MYKNTVELIGYYGSDETHALSAWTSTSRELTDDKRKRIPQLLKKLVEGSDGNSHETPFEKSSLHFLVTTDIASHIHIIKHRIAVSVNTESARYRELDEDKYLLPDDWTDDICSTVDEVPISEHFNHFVWDSDVKYLYWKDVLDSYNQLGNALYHAALKELEKKLGRKRAKESARFFKPYSSQITADVMFNFRSFIHFQKLRNAAGAQKEIREIADKMLNLVRDIDGQPFKHSLEAFGF